MVTTSTVDVLLVVFAPADTGQARLAEVLAVTGERMRAYTGAVAEVLAAI